MLENNSFLKSCMTMAMLVTIVVGLWTTPIFELTNKYIETGTYELTTPFYGDKSLASLDVQTFMINYVGTFPSPDCVLAFQNIDYQIGTDMLLNITIVPCAYYVTGLQTCLYSTSLFNLRMILIRYMVLDTTFKKITFYSLNYYLKGSSRLLNDSNPITISYELSPIAFGTGKIQNFLIISGMNVSSKSGVFDLQGSASRISDTTLQLTISTSCTTNLNFMGMGFTLGSWNVQQTQTWPFPAARLNYKSYSIDATGIARYIDDLNVVRDFNSFWGTFRFYIQNQPSLTWKSEVNPSVEIIGAGGNEYKFFDWCGIVFQFKECDPSTPYYYVPGEICYDICLPRMYTDTVEMLCGDCSLSAYDCYTCDTTGTFCQTCNETLDFRVLNSITKRCIPLDGYFDDGSNSTRAQPCDLTVCATCNTSKTQCFTCQSGFFLSGTSCLPCVDYCSVCTGSNNCQMCMDGFFLSGNNCKIDCAAIINCDTCSDALGCTVCSNYYAFVNLTTCSPICGDGTVIGTQSCDDGNLADGDGCSSLCLVQTSFYCQTVSGKSICGYCIANCLNCSTLSDCLVCQTSFIFKSSISQCVVDCSAIEFCSSCILNVSALSGVTCSICQLGYERASNNTCAPVCGDGITILIVEACDDHNTVSGDGCSYDCSTIEKEFYCSLNTTNGSICSPCMQNCIVCSSAVTCTECNALSLLTATTPPACNADCTLILNCNFCHIATGTLFCDACSLGYYPSADLQSCVPVCGDGILLASQACDDGNLNSGDGCSNICIIESSFYCDTFASVPNSVCSPCLQYCLACSSNSTCTSCFSPATFSGSACVVACPIVTTCSTCGFSSSLAVICATCLSGYSLTGDQCLPVCGDGILLGSEACDDANSVSGDGCSSSCSVESYFICNTTSAAGYSVCSLVSLKLEEKALKKDPLSNKVTIIFQLAPGNLPIFNSIDWSTVLVPPLGNTITGYSYDSESGLLNLDLSYSSDLTDNFQLGINSNSSSFFQFLGSEKTDVGVSSSNNQALVAYSEEVYALSSAVKYLSLAAGVLALLMTIVALFGGKLIGLQVAAVVQMAFLSLLTVDSMSPPFAALLGFGLSCGFNRLHPYNLAESIDRPFKGIQVELNFALNFNIMALLVALPLLTAAISKLLANTILKHRFNLLTLIGQYCLFEFTFYGYLFNAYAINSAFIVALVYFSQAKDTTVHSVGLIFGLAFIVIGVVYAILFRRQVKFFGEFKTKFLINSFGQNFYLIIVGERLLTSILLVSMISVPFQNVFLALIDAALLAVIVIKQPYIGKRKCLRPILNTSIRMAIQLLFLSNNFSSDPKSIFALFGPIIIVLLVFICILFNIYYLVQDFRDSLLKLQNFSRQYNQYTKQEIQNMEFQDLKAVILKGKDESIMKNVDETLRNMSAKELDNRWKDYCREGSEPNSKTYELADIRNQLKQMKMSAESEKVNISITYNQQDLNLIS